MFEIESGYAKATRFKFLVLEGDSRVGKTRFAESLYGSERTLVISMQSGCLVPPLRDFNRSKHRCIIFDEGSAAMVICNKQLFQAGLDRSTLGQSPTSCHIYTVWLYARALVVTTNLWAQGALSDADWDWLLANSVHVKVDSPLFEPEPLMLTDG